MTCCYKISWLFPDFFQKFKIPWLNWKFPYFSLTLIFSLFFTDFSLTMGTLADGILTCVAWKEFARKVLVTECGSITRLSLNSCHDNKWINRDTPKNKKHLVSITTLINSWTNRVIKLLDKSRSHKNIHLPTKCQSKQNSSAVVVCQNISEASWSNSVDPAQTAPLGTV